MTAATRILSAIEEADAFRLHLNEPKSLFMILGQIGL